VSDPVQPLAGCCILVVEDEYLIAMDVKRWLMAAGATVAGPVPSVNQALDILKENRLTAAVLDINLGNGDTVYPVAAELNALGVPYIFATGDVNLLNANDCRDHLRLNKPYLEVELVRALAELVLGSKPRPKEDPPRFR